MCIRDRHYIASQSLPFQYIHSVENLGVARGRNKGIALAKAPIIITIDDDAYFKEEDALIKIEKLFHTSFATENNVAVSYTHLDVYKRQCRYSVYF